MRRGDDVARGQRDAVRGGWLGGTARLLSRDRWVMPYFKSYRRVLALALGLGVLAVVLACLLMYVSGWLIGAAARMPETILALMAPIALTQVLGIGKPVVAYFERLASHDWVFRMTSDLRRRLFLALCPSDVRLDADGPETAGRGAGDVLALLGDDIAHIQNLYVRCVFPLVVSWAAVVLFCIVLGVASPLFAAWMLLELFVCAAVLPAVSLALGATARTRRKRAGAALYRELTDAVLGAADVVFAGRVDAVMEAFGRRAGEVAREDARIAAIDRAQGVVVRAVLALSAMGLAVWAATGLADAGDVAIGAVLCFFPLVEAVMPAGEAAATLPEHVEAIRRLDGLDVGAGDPSATDPIRHPEREGEAADASRHPERSRAAAESKDLPRLDLGNSALAFHNVTFSYSGAPAPVLSDLSFTLAPGTKTALLGRSGAGKSTIISLIRGEAVPSSGSIEVLGAPHPGAEGICPLVGVITQDPHVFNTTVLDNLRLARADVTEDEAREALERVGLMRRVERFEHGLLSVVGEEGRLLSGGERHRLALARVLVAHTPIVVLDEPFAGLDPATERAVLDALFDVLADRTVLMVTHHLQGVERMDRVAFLEDGRFVMDGSPEDLERTSARFRHLRAADLGLEG